MDHNSDFSSCDENEIVRVANQTEQSINFSGADEAEMVKCIEKVERQKYKCDLCDKM